MKKIVKNSWIPALFLVAIGLMAFTTKPKLPAEISSYLQNHFDGQNVVKYKTEWTALKKKHKVYLANGVKVKFDSKKEVYKIEGKAGLPLSVLPTPLAEYMKAHYPDEIFTEWKKKSYKQEIELRNGLELEFDLDGNFMRIDD